MNVSQLDNSEFNPYYKSYIDRAQGLDIRDGFAQGFQETIEFFRLIPESKLEYRYQEGKWTIKEILLHLIDSERVFSYRALRIGRGDKTHLPGFEQDDYIGPSRANERTMNDLLNEYSFVRKASEELFKGFSDDALLNIGVASNSDVSTRAIGFIIMGHERHHCHIIKERYL